MALGKMAPERRFEMVGRAVDQLRREGFLAGTRFASFHATLAALRDAAGARAAKNENHFSSVTVALRPADIPAAQAGAVGPGAGSVTRGEVVQMLAASEQKMTAALAGQKRDFDQMATDLKTDLSNSMSESFKEFMRELRGQGGAPPQVSQSEALVTHEPRALPQQPAAPASRGIVRSAEVSVAPMLPAVGTGHVPSAFVRDAPPPSRPASGDVGAALAAAAAPAVSATPLDLLTGGVGVTPERGVPRARVAFSPPFKAGDKVFVELEGGYKQVLAESISGGVVKIAVTVAGRRQGIDVRLEQVMSEEQYELKDFDFSAFTHLSSALRGVPDPKKAEMLRDFRDMANLPAGMKLRAAAAGLDERLKKLGPVSEVAGAAGAGDDWKNTALHHLAKLGRQVSSKDDDEKVKVIDCASAKAGSLGQPVWVGLQAGRGWELLQELVADGYHRPPEVGGEFVWFRDDAERFQRLHERVRLEGEQVAHGVRDTVDKKARWERLEEAMRIKTDPAFQQSPN